MSALNYVIFEIHPRTDWSRLGVFAKACADNAEDDLGFLEQYVTQRGHCHQDRAMSILENLLPSQSNAVLITALMAVGKVVVRKTNCEVA